MTEPISIKELISIILKNGKRMVCLCLVLALLAGGMQLYLQWDNANSLQQAEEQLELEYQTALVQYETQKAQLESVLKSTEEYLNGHRQYMNTSVLMRIDASYRPTSQTELKISNTSQQGGVDLTETVANLYVAAWEDADLAVNLTDHPYTYLGSQFVRELVSVTYSPENATLVIRADAETPEASRMLCDAAYKYILKVQEQIKGSGMPHDLEIQTQIDTYYSDNVLWETQTWRTEEIKKAQGECDAYRYELELLVPPVKVSGEFKINFKTIAVWMLLGAVMGVLLVGAVVVARYIGCDYIGSSRQMAGLLAVPHLGSVTKVEDFWGRLAAGVSDEPYWPNVDDGRRYLVENIAARVPENARIALASTLKIAEDDALVQPVMQMLTDRGYTVTFVADAYCNADTICAFHNSEYVVLLEKPGKTSRVAVMGVKDLGDQLCGSVLGFAFV